MAVFAMAYHVIMVTSLSSVCNNSTPTEGWWWWWCACSVGRGRWRLGSTRGAIVIIRVYYHLLVCCYVTLCASSYSEGPHHTVNQYLFDICAVYLSKSMFISASPAVPSLLLLLLYQADALMCIGCNGSLLFLPCCCCCGILLKQQC